MLGRIRNGEQQEGNSEYNCRQSGNRSSLAAIPENSEYPLKIMRIEVNTANMQLGTRFAKRN